MVEQSPVAGGPRAAAWSILLTTHFSGADERRGENGRRSQLNAVLGGQPRRMTTSSETQARRVGYRKRGLRALAAGAIIAAVQLLVLILSNNAIVMVLIGPALAWSAASWVLGAWGRMRVINAWPIGFADLGWLFLAGGMHDALEGPRGSALLFASVAVLSLGVGGACFWGRDFPGGTGRSEGGDAEQLSNG